MSKKVRAGKKKHLCMQRGQRFVRYSPGCDGEVKHPSAVLSLNPKTKRWKRVPGKTCRLHHMESAFGIYALKCPKCHDHIQDETDGSMSEDERYTYIPVELFFAPPKFGWWAGKSAFDIRCWHCGFRFFKKSRWKPTQEYVQRYVQAWEWMDGSKGLETITPEDVK